jgi:hypothetical protein
VIISASATDTNGGVAQIDFYLGGVLFRTVTNMPFSATITNAALGSYQTFAVARDTFGLSATSAIVNFTVVPPGTNFADMFANRGFISGYTNFKTGSNVGASKESGEPNHWQFNAGGRSVWLSWTAPSSGVVTIDLANSSFDTVLAVYSNAPDVAPAVNNLIKVAENDDNGVFLQSKVIFTNTTPGTVFHIAVDGYSSGSAASGNILMRLNLLNTTPLPLNLFGRITNGVFTMTFTGGTPNREYLLESSTTLTSWNPVTTIMATGAVTIVDSEPPLGQTLKAFRTRPSP